MEEKLLKKIIKYAFLLAAFCIAASASLAVVYKITAPKIEEEKLKKIISAKKDVLPLAVEFTDTDSFTEGYDAEGRLIGRILKVTAMGYGGPIDMMAGIDEEYRLSGIKILSHTETPGLGSKIEQRSFLDQLSGKTKEQLILKKDGGEIDAISGATISSRAVIDNLKKSLEQVVQGN